MKIREAGIDYIDKTLGRLYNGLSMLMVSDSFSMNDADRLAALFALNFLEKGGAVISVHTNLPFNIIQKQVEKNYSHGKNEVFQKAVTEGRFHFLSLVSSENRINTSYNVLKSVREIANDPNRIVYEINDVKNRIRQDFPDTLILVTYTNISSSIIDFDSRTVLKMIRRLVLDAKREGYIFLGTANRDVHESTVTNTLNHIVDYAMNFSLETIYDQKHTYVYVSKTPLLKEAHKILNQRVAYHFSSDNFITLFPLYPSFDELKESMSFNEWGQISVLGWNHIITPIQTLTIFLDSVEKLFGHEKNQEILFDLGRKVGVGAARLVESGLQISDEKLFLEVLKYNTAAGWGRLLSTEGSIDGGKLKIAGISTVALSYGRSDHPVCTFIAGGLAGILKVATKKDWSARETKCIAMGNELCEFELELK
ncbi:MAG: V4R domain-containing protein [Candidatus Jordarchaeum sp.]|uniref:V4R domain-containing protein n=1 Tax=Candidatus Jordarchaeum sp. TaxID=2823881 RepID=UPI00404A136E